MKNTEESGGTDNGTTCLSSSLLSVEHNLAAFAMRSKLGGADIENFLLN